MSDPAVEAAQRAMAHDPHCGVSLYDIAEIRVNTARETLKPIKSMWFREMGADNGASANERFQRIGKELARLIFTDDEMEGGIGE